MPYNDEVERALLGTVLLRGDILDEAPEAGIGPETFYRLSYGHIWSAAQQVRARGDIVDPLTIDAELRRSGLLEQVGGSAELVSLQANAPPASTWPGLARILRSLALRRRLQAVAGELGAAAADETREPEALLEQAQTLLFSVEGERRGGPQPIAKDMDAYLGEVDARMRIHRGGIATTGLSWGVPELDDITLGLHPGQLVIVGARPSMGKTAMAMQIATAAALGGNVALVFSLEMSALELKDRYMSSQALIDLRALRAGAITPGDRDLLTGWAAHASAVPLYVDDDPMRTVASIGGASRLVRNRYGRLDLIVVDYLQLVTVAKPSTNRANDVAEMSRGLKLLARQMEVPIVAASQLSRQLEARQDKRPMLSDLRESGGLEQDADVVAFIFRDEVYNAQSQDRGYAEVHVAKQRNGPTDTVKVRFDAQTGRWLDRQGHYGRGVPAIEEAF